MKHVYFIRHGQSTFNVGRLNAGVSNVPLTLQGVQQAEEAGRKANLQDLKIDVVLSSPLERAHETAKTVAKHINYPLREIVIDDRLIERNFGELEGQHLPVAYGISFEQYHVDPFAIDHIPGVEKITDLQYRANKFLEYLVSRPEDTILVVGHGAFARSLYRAINNAPLTEPVKAIGNAEIVKLI